MLPKTLIASLYEWVSKLNLSCIWFPLVLGLRFDRVLMAPLVRGFRITDAFISFYRIENPIITCIFMIIIFHVIKWNGKSLVHRISHLSFWVFNSNILFEKISISNPYTFNLGWFHLASLNIRCQIIK